MRILYLGPNAAWTTSRHRADALRRCGHEVVVKDLHDYLPDTLAFRKYCFRMGRLIGNRFITSRIYREFQKEYHWGDYDLLWVNQQIYAGPEMIAEWTKRIPSILYINDNPFAGVNGKVWDQLLCALPYYSVVGVVRDEDVLAARAIGSNTVERVYMSYDEIVHAPIPFSSNDAKEWGAKVVFVGSHMPERGPFLAELIRLGVPVEIYGSGWSRAKQWSDIRKHYRGGWVSGQEYVKAIQYADIVIGMLSVLNRDQYTRRSVEVPYVGSLLCCKRTNEHEQLFVDGVEAVMWDDAYECAVACETLLSQPCRAKDIAANGRRKVMAGNFGNEYVVSRLVACV